MLGSRDRAVPCPVAGRILGEIVLIASSCAICSRCTAHRIKTPPTRADSNASQLQPAQWICRLIACNALLTNLTGALFAFATLGSVQQRDELPTCWVVKPVVHRLLEGGMQQFIAIVLTLTALLASLPAWAGTEDIQRLNAAAERYARSELPRGTTVVATGLDTRLQLPRCSAQPQGTRLIGNAASGAATVEVRCLAAEGWKLFVPVRTQQRSYMIVATSPIAAGTAIAADQVERVEQAVRGASRGYITDLGVVVGQVARRHIAAGSILRPQWFAAANVIDRGQMVTLVARAGGVEIRSRGEALQAASSSGLVKVRNLSSGRIIEGRAQSDGSVLVN